MGGLRSPCTVSSKAHMLPCTCTTGRIPHSLPRPVYIHHPLLCLSFVSAERHQQASLLSPPRLRPVRDATTTAAHGAARCDGRRRARPRLDQRRGGTAHHRRHPHLPRRRASRLGPRRRDRRASVRADDDDVVSRRRRWVYDASHHAARRQRVRGYAPPAVLPAAVPPRRRPRSRFVGLLVRGSADERCGAACAHRAARRRPSRDRARRVQAATRRRSSAARRCRSSR